MLANRADVWNLGDVLSGRDDLFALSYIENALTSNPVLAPLSTRERGDIELLVRLARGDSSVLPDQLAHPYSAVELEQILSVLRKLLRVQRGGAGRQPGLHRLRRAGRRRPAPSRRSSSRAPTAT